MIGIKEIENSGYRNTCMVYHLQSLRRVQLTAASAR